MKKLLNAVKILKKERYLMIFISVSLIFNAVLYYLNLLGASTIGNFLIINGLAFALISFGLGFLISISFGLYMAMFVYKYDCVMKNNITNTTGSFFGGIFGALGAGCPGCGFTLFSALGIPIGLASLPFNGLELKFAGLFVLLISNYFIARDIDKKVCKIKK